MADLLQEVGPSVKFLDERQKHQGKVFCHKFDAIVRNHHLRDSTGSVDPNVWGWREGCEGPHSRLAIIPIED